MTEAALTAQIQAITPSNPQMAQALNQVLTSGQFKSLQLFAMDYEGLKPVGSVNVLALPLGGMSLDVLAPVLEGQFKQVGATDVTSSHATVLGVDALVINYHLNVKGASTTTTSSGRAYLVPVGGTAYDVTVTCLGSNVTSCMSDGDTMVHGMTVGPY
jgi:hypothetical protein